MAWPGGARITMFAAAACLVASSTAAQGPDRPIELGAGRVTLAGEATLIGSVPDADAFFNYTDYEHNGLRTVRLRLLGEWRLPARFAVLGEFRTENAQTPDAAALYLRWRPQARRDLDIQLGRIPPVVGAFARRAYGRDNPLIGTPLAYQYLTSLRPDALPITIDDLLRMRARGWRPSYPLGAQTQAAGVPLISSGRWDTGIEARLAFPRVQFAGALTRGTPAVPVIRETNGGRSWSGRTAVTVVPGLTLGVSGQRGQWVQQSVLALLPSAIAQGAVQSLVGTDGEFGHGHWLVRGEWLRSGFQVPLVSQLSVPTFHASAGFLEARYRWHPRWQIAGRVDRLTFDPMVSPTLGGAPLPWEAPVRRLEAALGFRATRNVETRVGWQRNWRDGGRVHLRDYPALQLLYWF